MFDCVVFSVIVARAVFFCCLGTLAVRTSAGAAVRVRVVVAVRAVRFGCVLRVDVVLVLVIMFCWVVRARVRGTDVRAVVVGARWEMFVVRLLVSLRWIVFASRTAASAVQTPIITVRASCRTFLIRLLYI